MNTRAPLPRPAPRRVWLAVLPMLLVLGGTSCHSPRPVRTTPATAPVHVPPPAPPPGELLSSEPPLLPPVEVKAAALGNPFENRRLSIDLTGGDVKEVLRALVRDSDLGLVIDPGIEGTVPVMDLKECRLGDILGYILPPLGLSAEWRGATLHVGRVPFVTRYFRFDYLAMVRKGTRQVSFSTRSNEGGSSCGGGGSGSGSSGGGQSSSGGGGSGGGISGSGGQNQTSSSITVNNENAVWNTFIESLKTMVFGSLALPATQTGTQGETGAEGRITPFAHTDAAGRSLIVTPETGLVVITAPEAEVARSATFIERFQGSAQRQVWIEARILEVNLSKAYQLGVDWGAVVNRGDYYGTLDQKRSLSSPAVSFTPGAVQDQDLSASSYGAFQMAVSNNVVDIMIDALSRQGQLKVLASPKISTMNNEKAVIRVVREEAFFNLETQVSQGTGSTVSAPTINVQIVPIGIVMDIVPQINDRGEILLSINPDISELLEVKKFEVAGAMATQPVIDRRSIDTLARLRDGQTLVIAGILKEKKNESIRGVPFLSKLPLIGNAFRRTEQRSERTELVILITPTVVSGQTADQLTRQERESVERAMHPNRLGDAFPLREGLAGEVDPLKKDPKRQGQEW